MPGINLMVMSHCCKIKTRNCGADFQIITWNHMNLNVMDGKVEIPCSIENTAHYLVRLHGLEYP